MLKNRIFIFFACLASVCGAQEIKKPGKVDNKVLLPNGWWLTPAGHSLPLGDLPLNMVVASSKRFLAVTNNGQSTQSVQLIDIKNEKVLDEVVIDKSWYGLAFSNNDRFLYASRGNDNQILKYEVAQNRLQLADSITLGQKWPVKISPAGICVDEGHGILYVVTKENNSLYLINIKSGNIIQDIPLGGEGYMALLSSNKKELYITCWGCNKVRVFQTDTRQFSTDIPVGSNPNEMCLSKDGQWLFVANANDNSVSVINTYQKKVVETLNAALYPDAPCGSTTNGLALSEDQKTLYVANADNNCLAVFDVTHLGQSKSKGFIPVGWYPTNVKVIGNRIFVANGKGFTSMANPLGPNPLAKNETVRYRNGDSSKPIKVQYIAGLFKGTLSIIKEPSAAQLATYSRQVYENTPYSKKKEQWASVQKEGPIPDQPGKPCPIKYVFYIIKENRTYDQVLGDMKEGNGDSSLTLFGNKVTPNQHALSRQFVLLDNFYCDAEVSADGHNWSLGGYATDYLEKTWPTSYGGRGGSYDAEGNRAIANNKNGFIWDYCRRAGKSYRTYGEFADDYKPNLPVLKGHFCPYFTSWDQTVRDTVRVHQWERDFDSLVEAKQLPSLNTLRLINDHTEGLKLGRPTPTVHVADNDLAVGMFVEHLSHSPVWKESVVFIVEDDAQNGSDHVDAHRTTAYIAGGFVKRGFVDHTMYSTTSMVHTIELILGLPPMSQYDAAATPMSNCFQMKPDLTPFRALPSNIDLTEKNVARNKWQKTSESFDLTREDAVPDQLFNEVLWHGIKGDQPFPGPIHAAFIKITSNKKNDD